MKMKKILKTFIMLFIFTFALTACDKHEDVEKDNKNDIEKTTLETPTLYVNLEDNTFSWTNIVDAKGYVVNINDVDQNEQTSTSFKLTGDSGTYNVKVKAIGDENYFKDSDYSSVITVTIASKKLDKPQISLNDNVISWEAISNAESYVVNINGEDKTTITKTNYNFESSDYGSFFIKVKAINSEIESDYSNTVEIGVYDSYLQTPVIEIENNTLKWNSVKKANEYIINVNGEDFEKTTDLSYDFDNFKTGSYTFKVKALSTDNIMYGPSEYSNEVDIDYVWEIKLDTPNVVLNSTRLTWEQVSNASSYEIYLDGERVTTITNNEYPLTVFDGVHTLKVKALSDNERYLESDFSKEITHKTSKTGFLNEATGDFIQYVGTTSYVQVTNALELFTALNNAKYDYETTIGEVITVNDLVVRNNVRKNESNWKNALNKGLYLKNEDGTYFKIPVDTPFSDTSYTADMVYYEDSNDNLVSYTQKINNAGTVHVIEIMNDLDLGWKKLSSAEQEFSFVNNFSSGKETNEAAYTMSSMYNESGMTQISVSKCYNLLIYSNNGSTIKHAGFKVESSNNVCFRNLKFDELWQWEDTSSSTTGAVGDMDAFGWAYFKINFCDEIWIDHCSFGKAYDGIIDVANPTYNTLGTAVLRAPYNADGSCDVHISYCEFNPILTDDIESNYIYLMMEEIKADYEANNNHYLYYKALRDAGFDHTEILYGIAIPQKKAFLDGDSGNGVFLNTNLNISIAYCKFVDIEDRLPKLRSGNAYVYGTVIDCSRYSGYRDILKAKIVDNKTISAKEVVAKVNTSWKCALVSHALMASMEGSLYAYGCIFKGVETLMCNNESDGSKGSIIIDNSQYIYKNIDYTGSNLDNDNKFSLTGYLSTEYFLWRTDDNSIPFFVEDIDLSTLETYLNQNVGVNNSYPENYLLKNLA